MLGKKGSKVIFYHSGKFIDYDKKLKNLNVAIKAYYLNTKTKTISQGENNHFLEGRNRRKGDSFFTTNQRELFDSFNYDINNFDINENLEKN